MLHLSDLGNVLLLNELKSNGAAGELTRFNPNKLLNINSIQKIIEESFLRATFASLLTKYGLESSVRSCFDKH